MWRPPREIPLTDLRPYYKQHYSSGHPFPPPLPPHARMQVALCFGSGAAKYLFGQEPEVASLVGQFCWGLLPGMWPLVLGLVLMKYLQTQVRGRGRGGGGVPAAAAAAAGEREGKAVRPSAPATVIQLQYHTPVRRT